MTDFDFALPSTPTVPSSGVAFASIKSAIQSWVVNASGLAGDHVVWSPLRDTRGNPVPRPVGLFVSLSIAGVRSPGFDDTSIYTVDDDGLLTQSIVGPRILVLFVQVYQGSPVGGNDVDPISTLNNILAGADRDDIALALSLAKVAIGTYEDPQHVPALYNEAKQELRAFSTVKLFIGSNLAYTTQGTGWLDTATATGTLTTELGDEVVIVQG